MDSVDSSKEIREGFRAARTYTISQRIYESFLGTFEDVNPIHVDDELARSHGFPGVVMHGMILNGFISHFVGSDCPGGGVLRSSALASAVDATAPTYETRRIRRHRRSGGPDNPKGARISWEERST